MPLSHCGEPPFLDNVSRQILEVSVMPQTINIGGYSDTGAALARPACAILIAAIVTEWSHVEEALAQMVTMGMGTPFHDQATGSRGVRTNVVAWAAMQEVIALRTRLQIVDRSLRAHLQGEMLSEWAPLMRALSSRAKERNIVAHTRWYHHADYPESLLCHLPSGFLSRYDPQDFVNIYRRMVECRNRTSVFLHKAIAHQGQFGMAPGT
jgi:hypothetical protein